MKTPRLSKNGKRLGRPPSSKRSDLAVSVGAQLQADCYWALRFGRMLGRAFAAGIVEGFKKGIGQ